MDIWVWIVVYAVALTLLQLLVYRYLVNSGGSLTRRVGSPFGDRDRDSSWGDHTPGSDTAQFSSTDSGADADSPSRTPASTHTQTDRTSGERSASGRPCPHCGVTNERDETFSRCWNCTQQL